MFPGRDTCISSERTVVWMLARISGNIPQRILEGVVAKILTIIWNNLGGEIFKETSWNVAWECNNELGWTLERVLELFIEVTSKKYLSVFLK